MKKLLLKSVEKIKHLLGQAHPKALAFLVSRLHRRAANTLRSLKVSVMLWRHTNFWGVNGRLYLLRMERRVQSKTFKKILSSLNRLIRWLFLSTTTSPEEMPQRKWRVLSSREKLRSLIYRQTSKTLMKCSSWVIIKLTSLRGGLQNFTRRLGF